MEPAHQPLAVETLLVLSEAALYRLILAHLHLRLERKGIADPEALERFADEVRRLAWHSSRSPERDVGADMAG